MLFTKIFAIASLAASAVAQSILAFTATPGSVQAGKSTTIRWTGGTGGPVTITLKKGSPTDLKTVAVLTGDATGDTFNWTPSSDLANGSDYALSISQGVDTINYSGLFSLSGGSSVTGTATILSLGASTTAAISTLTGKVSSTTSSASLSTTVVVTLAPPLVTGGSSVGTGTVMSRNTTFSSPTLASATTTLTSLATTLSSGSATGSRTSSGAATSSSAGAGAGLHVQGAMGAGALAAALFWL